MERREGTDGQSRSAFWFSCAAGVLVLAGMLSACEPAERNYGVGPGGAGGQGAGGAGGSGPAGSGAGMPVQCMVDSDCPLSANPCMRNPCTAGTCVEEPVPAGKATDSQVYGDCRRRVCDGMGTEEFQEDIADIFDDGKECTGDFCSGGVVFNDPTAIGTLCEAGGYCDAAANCVDCTISIHCAGGKLCKGGKCVAASCSNGVADPGETDVDCGGACTPCISGKACQLAVDCASKVCVSQKCASPTCADGVRNGDETSSDCGGNCLSKCDAGAPCLSPSDCASSVCVAGLCQTPSCVDGRENGDEFGVDCGGSCLRPCP